MRVPAFECRLTLLPSAISGGGVSPMGEPLAILPPMVPMLRTCSPPMRWMNGFSAGIWVESVSSAWL